MEFNTHCCNKIDSAKSAIPDLHKLDDVAVVKHVVYLLMLDDDSDDD